MAEQFPTIGIFAKPHSRDITETLKHLLDFLAQRQHTLLIEELSAANLAPHQAQIKSAKEVAQECDLAIVVGGDGSLLKASRAIVEHDVPILGINRGRLGFLADVKPAELETTLTDMLNGKFEEENRTLLQATIVKQDAEDQMQLALNDVVLYNGDLARMIDFEIYVDDQYVMLQRADGLITSTPTGSTAYALSAGGPILYPTLNAFTLVPMFPHTLSSRPIVIHSNSKIKLSIPEDNSLIPKISCDGQEHVSLSTSDEVEICKFPQQLRLLHPCGYNYFALLREKLGWNSRMTSSDR